MSPRRSAILVAGLAVALAAGGIAVSNVRARTRAREDRERELSLLANDVAMAATELVTCVLGDDPKVQFERVRLAEELTPTPGGQWPIRCAPYAVNMAAVAAKSADAGVPHPIGPMKEVDGELRDGSTEHLLEAIAAVEPLATKHADTRVPRPAAPLMGGVLGGAPMYARQPSVDVRDVDVLDGELHVPLSGVGESASCVVDGVSFVVRCTPPLAGVGSVLAFAKGAEPIFLRLEAVGVEGGVVDRSGKMLLAGAMVVHGHAFADGRVTVLSNGGSGLPDLATRAPDGKITHRPGEYGSSNPRAAANHVLWKAVDGASPDAPAAVRVIRLDDGAVRTIGKVKRRPDGSVASTGHCATATHLFVDLSPAIAVRDAKGAWSVVEVEAQPADAERGLSCEADRLRILDVSTSLLRVQDCAAAACTTRSAAIDVADGVLAASLGPDDFLLVWRKRWGLVGARGPLQSIATAAPFAIATREPHEKPAEPGAPELRIDSTTKVVSVPGGAIVFVHGLSRLHAFGVRRDGTVVPMVDAEK